MSRSGSVFTPLAVGAVLMVMIYAGGHVSGAHYNPAVTLAVWIRGKIDGPTAAAYWGAQLVGGTLGAVAARSIVEVPTSVAITPPVGSAAALAAEALFTFALAYVVLNVATSRSHPDNGFYGLAIGFTVTAGAFAVGGVSGAAFNPAVAVGASAVGLFSWSAIWVYLVGNLLGAAAAAGVFLAINPDDRRAKADTASRHATPSEVIEDSPAAP